jgi:acyl-CoA synthetase (AMP-forming)/AMP-acid ligase II
MTNSVSYSFLTPQSFLNRNANVFRDKDAIVYRQKRWTYAQFAARVNQLANALRKWGIQKGDRIAFICPNIPPMLEAHFGVPLAGGVLVAINIRLSSKDIRHILNDSGARLVFIDTEFSHLVASVREELETVEAIWQKYWDNLPIEERARLKARQGVPYIHAAEMRVVDKDMNDIPADGETMGEVVMRGNNVMNGYFNDPEATANAFRGGWFHSGDLAVMYPDGYIELRDRAKDIIISTGVNISTIEVERAIYKHPDVLEVAVISIPDETRGEVPKAFVTLKPDTNTTKKEIIQFCRQHLALFKCPKSVEFCELPKTATGKVQKYLLREKEWAGYDKRIH